MCFYIGIEDLIVQFRGYLALDVLMALIDERSVKVLSREVQQKRDGFAGRALTLMLRISETVKPDGFLIIHRNCRPPVMIVTHLCVNLIIG